jgi:hypothetical protein
MGCLQKSSVTHLDLLKRVDPMLGSYYENVIDMRDMLPVEKFEFICKDEKILTPFRLVEERTN